MSQFSRVFQRLVLSAVLLAGCAASSGERSSVGPQVSIDASIDLDAVAQGSQDTGPSATVAKSVAATFDATSGSAADSIAERVDSSLRHDLGLVPIESCPGSEIDTIDVDDLPDEALDTLRLIRDGGPYPFRADDGVFQNREELLPDADRGYYREYTVITPDDDDRGARRIIAGECGEKFYTRDHYDSFKLIEG